MSECFLVEVSLCGLYKIELLQGRVWGEEIFLKYPDDNIIKIYLKTLNSSDNAT